MNNLRTFRTIKENNSGSDYIQKRKQKNIYCATRDLAKNGGVYYKKSTLGRDALAVQLVSVAPLSTAAALVICKKERLDSVIYFTLDNVNCTGAPATV